MYRKMCEARFDCLWNLTSVKQLFELFWALPALILIYMSREKDSGVLNLQTILSRAKDGELIVSKIWNLYASLILSLKL